jgi:pyruvate/2-oxoglutarate dehydrogenase complex dihydrolipoamide acyltransferase (E2) component
MEKRRFGDRKDARRVKMPGMNQIAIDLKPNRSVSDVYINQKMDLTNLCKYIEKKKKEGKDITIFHAFVTAIGKTIYNRPKLNYFIANRHMYEHNDVVISFVAKVSFEDKAEEMMILIKIDPEDTLETVSKKIKDKVADIRENKDVNKKGANSAIDVLAKLPNIIRVPLVGILKWTDKVGILPSSLVEDNLYYSSMIVSNLGAIKCGAIHHNITDFGACSTLATMGEIKDEEVLMPNGKKEIRKICEFGINLDERIADGYYFAKSVKVIQDIFNNPELMERRADEKIETGEIR